MTETAGTIRMAGRRQSRPVTAVLRGAAVIALVVWSMFPILWIVITSLKRRVDILAGPSTFLFTPTLDAYQDVLTSSGSGVLNNLLNSLIVTVAGTVVALLIAALAAYSLSRYSFRGKGGVMQAILASRLLPPVATVVPLFIFFSALGLIDTQIVLVIIYAALNAPFATWLLKSFFDAVPVDLEEAALVDGCSRLGSFWRITFRLAAPGLVATALIIGNMVWNEFMFAFMFTSVHAGTLPVALGELQGSEQTPWQDIAAEATILLLPAVVVGVWAQKYLVRGLTAGAVK